MAATTTIERGTAEREAVGSRSSGTVDVVVVGSGPNGLSAATVLAGAGLSVHVVEAADTLGGGARSAALTLPGFTHDVCSAVHPAAALSRFFAAFDLAGHGVEMLHPPLPFAQALDGGRAALAHRDIEATVDGLGVDGPAYRRLVGPVVARIEEVRDLVLSDLRTFPGAWRGASVGAGIALARAVAEQGSPAWNLRWRGDLAPALLSGVATHAIAPARRLAPAGSAVFLTAMAHSVGWPIPRGGSQAIVDALVAELRARGVTFSTGERVEDLAQLPRTRAVVMDTSPETLVDVVGDRLPAAYRAAVRAYRHGDGVCKVDFALSQPVPWTNPGLAGAGTLHLGGTRAEMLAFERGVVAGRHSDLPYVLAAQPGVVDPSRAPAGKHTLWAYTHVPKGSTLDRGDAVAAQVERFAPGFHDTVLARAVSSASAEEASNANYVGGDISGGAVTPWQLLARPVPTWDPYRAPVPGVYLCSSSTPPGPAVHGMNGVHAARRVLRQRFGITTDPYDLVRSPVTRRGGREGVVQPHGDEHGRSGGEAEA